MQAAVRRDMIESHDRAVYDVFGFERIPCQWTWDSGVACGIGNEVEGLSLVLQKPHVVLVLVRVKRDLLLLRTGGVHVGMAVQISALSVVVSEADTRAKCDIRRDIRHALA